MTTNAAAPLQSSHQSTETPDFIPKSVILQYEGYKYVGKARRTTKENQEHRRDRSYHSSHLDPLSRRTNKGQTASSVRSRKITFDGHEYIGQHEYPKEDDMTMMMMSTIIEYNGISKTKSNGMMLQYKGEDRLDHHRQRNLKVIGIDDRTRVNDTFDFPYITIGKVHYDAPGGPGVCTAAIMNSSAILTAARCVYNITSNEWYNVASFEPARSYDPVQDTYRSFGRWRVETITILQDFADFGELSDDFAVITLLPDSFFPGDDYSLKGFVGEELGYLGLGYTNFSDPVLQSSTLTGFFADKEDGYSMWYVLYHFVLLLFVLSSIWKVEK
jgi:V8-like Glu-specific endopeptidase